MPGSDGIDDAEKDAVDSFLESVTYEPEDATREPQYSPAPNFRPGTIPMAGDGVGGGPVQTPYMRRDFDGVQPLVRVGPNFIMNPSDPGIAPAKGFDAPEPMDREQGPEAADLTEVVSVFKGAGAVKVRKGTFRNLVDQRSTGV